MARHRFPISVSLTLSSAANRLGVLGNLYSFKLRPTTCILVRTLLARSLTPLYRSYSAYRYTALRKLLAICEGYALEYCISFNALNSKCLVVIPKSRCIVFENVNDCVFTIAGRPIDIVKSLAHL